MAFVMFVETRGLGNQHALRSSPSYQVLLESVIDEASRPPTQWTPCDRLALLCHLHQHHVRIERIQQARGFIGAGNRSSNSAHNSRLAWDLGSSRLNVADQGALNLSRQMPQIRHAYQC